MFGCFYFQAASNPLGDGLPDEARSYSQLIEIEEQVKIGQNQKILHPWEDVHHSL
jgi:hypothetical protein